MTQEFTSNPLFSAWPFWMLQLDPSADNRDVEKAFVKITGQLKLQIPNAEFYESPLGTKTRDEFQLRDAKAILLDPSKRALAEFWYVKPDDVLNQKTPDTTNKAVDWKKLLGTV